MDLKAGTDILNPIAAALDGALVLIGLLAGSPCR
jgi:hypothetical protein